MESGPICGFARVPVGGRVRVPVGLGVPVGARGCLSKLEYARNAMNNEHQKYEYPYHDFA